MALIVEDGTVVAEANSYVTVADLRAFALARAITVPASDGAGDAQIEAALITALDYLQNVPCYQGSQADSDQELEWPRSGVYFNGTLYDSDAIPKKLKEAQIRLAIEVCNGVDLMPNTNASDFVVEETVGPITTKYESASKVGISPSFPMIDKLLEPLLSSACGHGFLNVYRG